MPHIFLATPCYGGLLTQSYMQSVLGCVMEAGQRGIQVTLATIGDDALITRARNTLLHQFFTRTDASHILFVDSDIGFSVSDIEALLAAEKPVIGGAYPLKARYWDNATSRLMALGEPPETASLRYVGDCASIYEQAGTKAGEPLAKVAYLGTGFLLIEREVVARLRTAHPETRYRRIDAPTTDASPEQDAYALFDCMIDPETQTYLSEDFTFCHRWRKLGGEVWLHRGPKLSHTGPSTFQGDPMIRRISVVS
ncbi:hypothetical protein [Brytella acorum]|uniref:Uncharacterized protein n=1 Tax=Brytella acorum TaxID=2959299 RepID=A0AA35XVL4_9PROT|nr:hypothetical protein [Brytella acorum]MDF3623713.1 hypothetical protein [Brytella acorum]CAI9119869.1 hypothetical protein LMG32879_000695 [Brytella acorum]